MCGICGFLCAGDGEDPAVTIERMTTRIAHRGPDDAGEWIDREAGVALGHRRLSIVDLSAAGHQPMTAASGRFVMVYNGEIYDHRSMRAELGARDWRGGSDTETLLAGFDTWGVEATLARATGMFAFALWDRETRSLTLGRDRMGEKPLYYGWQGGVFLFGSELKALQAHPSFGAEIDRDALTLQLRHNYIPTPFSIYRGIAKLPPATTLTLDREAIAARATPEPRPYWSLADTAMRGQADPFEGGDAAAKAALDATLREAVALQMEADVPLGAFLSGGIDSSAIVALMQAQSARPVKTFTIGFDVPGYDEAQHAKAIAAHLGTDHTELYVRPGDALDVIPALPAMYDEPFSDSSQIPTHLVSRMTREHVTVSLSGDGGDELFGGYNRYPLATALWRKVGGKPRALRRAMVSAISMVSPDRWDAIIGAAGVALPAKWRFAKPGDKLHKLAEVLDTDSIEDIYRALVSHWKDPSALVIGGSEPRTALMTPSSWLDLPDFEHRMMAVDSVSYLPDDILAKVDRASMAVSLECRVPFLDRHVVDLAWRLPLHMKIREGETKWLLRQVLFDYVPREMIERPKMGFGVPIGEWLRGPLRDWAEALLDEKRLREEGFFHPGPIREKWAEHLSGRRNWPYHLWDVLMFQAWHEGRSGTGPR